MRVVNVIVGSGLTETGDSKGFIIEGDQILDFNHPDGPAEPTALNNVGDSDYRGFIATPVPEPVAIHLGLVGLLFIVTAGHWATRRGTLD